MLEHPPVKAEAATVVDVMSFVVPQTIVALFNGNELGEITVAFGHVLALTC